MTLNRLSLWLCLSLVLSTTASNYGRRHVGVCGLHRDCQAITWLPGRSCYSRLSLASVCVRWCLVYENGPLTMVHLLTHIHTGTLQGAVDFPSHYVATCFLFWYALTHSQKIKGVNTLPRYYFHSFYHRYKSECSV